MPARRAYFDTSVLVKLYVWEEGSAMARTLPRRHRCVVSAIAPVEVVSALHRRAAAGDVDRGDLLRLGKLLGQDRAHWDLVEVDRQVLAGAERVVRDTGVRTLDAVHLASVLAVERYSRARVPFVTGDARQRDAGMRLGLDVVWVS